MNVCYQWALGLFFVFSTVSAHAQSVHGVLRVVKGDVQIKSAKSGQNVKARIGEKVFPKDVVITGKDARAKIVMVDNNEINVSPESQIEIQHYEFDPNAGKKEVLLNVIYGKVRSKVEQKYDGKTSKFQIKTPAAVAGVRGTDFITSHVNGISNVVTFHGAVAFGPPGMPPVMVMPGMTANFSPGGGLTNPFAVPKDQLAKMEGESRADGPKSGPGGGEQNGPRSPAGQGNDDNKPNRNPNGGPEECSTCAPPPPPPPPPLPPPPQPTSNNPLPPVPPDCPPCREAINKNTNLKIHVNTGP